MLTTGLPLHCNEAGWMTSLRKRRRKTKIEVIQREQAEGKLVAMTGTNDAPAPAQANVGVSNEFWYTGSERSS